MARYQRVFPMTDSAENSFAKVHGLLTGKKFKYENVDGQQVFRKGDGFWAAARFIRISYSGNFVRLEAWVDAMGSEMDLEGFVGCAAKKPLKKIVAEVEAVLTQPGYGYVPAENTGAFPVFAEEKQVLPAGITKREFIKHHAGESFQRNLRNTAIVGYIVAGLNLLIALTLNFFAMIDVAIILGLTLGMHLGKSKGCAIALLVCSILSTVIALVSTGQISGWLWIIASVTAVSAYSKMSKAYEAFKAGA